MCGKRQGYTRPRSPNRELGVPEPSARHADLSHGINRTLQPSVRRPWRIAWSMSAPERLLVMTVGLVRSDEHICDGNDEQSGQRNDDDSGPFQYRLHRWRLPPD